MAFTMLENWRSHILLSVKSTNSLFDKLEVLINANRKIRGMLAIYTYKLHELYHRRLVRKRNMVLQKATLKMF